MEPHFLTAGRAKILRNLLLALLGLALVLLLIGLLLLATGDGQGGTVVLGVAVTYAVLGGLSLRAVLGSGPQAKSLIIATGIVVIVLSVLIIGILIGLFTVIVGVGLLAITFAPDREDA